MKLGGFTCVFAEITDVMSLKPDSRKSGTRFQNTIYMRTEKNQTVFLLFLSFSRSSGGNKDAVRPRFAGGPRLRASVASLTLGNIFFVYRETRRLWSNEREANLQVGRIIFASIFPIKDLIFARGVLL